MWPSWVQFPSSSGSAGSHGGGFHQSLLSKQLLKVKNVFLTVFSCHTHTQVMRTFSDVLHTGHTSDLGFSPGLKLGLPLSRWFLCWKHLKTV